MSTHLRVAAVFTTVLLLAPLTYGQLVSLDFDDGTGPGLAIGSFYNSQGVTLSNARWEDVFNGRPGTSSPLQLGPLDTGSFPSPSSPIVASFAHNVNMVSISAIDVGFNDARMDAFDLGGNLLGSATYEGVSELGNTGNPPDTSVLSLAFPGIRSVELYQPQSLTVNDGVGFDNLAFYVVPEPGALGLAAIALMALAFRKHR